MGSFATDNGGVALKANIKILTPTSTWNTRLSQLSRQKGNLTISTYSLPNLDYVYRIFEKRPNDITILANSKFIDKAKKIKMAFPNLKIFLKDNVHAKLALIEPETVYLSSENFGNSSWFETAIGIKSVEAYEHYLSLLQGEIDKGHELVL